MKDKLNPNCGIRLRECRKAADMTQKQLADAIHTTYQSISNIERGERQLTVENARLASAILNVRMEYLLCEDDIKTYEDYNKQYLDDLNKKDENELLLSFVLGGVVRYEKGYMFQRNKKIYYFSDEDAEELYTAFSLLCDGWLLKVLGNQSKYGVDESTLSSKYPEVVRQNIKENIMNMLLYNNAAKWKKTHKNLI